MMMPSSERPHITALTALTALVAATALAAGPAHADAPRTEINLRVSGSGIAAITLAPRLAAELGTSVHATNAACPAPCIEVAVAGDHAVVRFTPLVTGDGERTPRERTIALGVDRTTWPLLITLLAGNLARDEAQDVLAMLPAPAPATTEPADGAPDDGAPVASPDEVDAAAVVAPAPTPPTPPTPPTAPGSLASLPALLTPSERVPRRLGPPAARPIPTPTIGADARAEADAPAEKRVLAIGIIPFFSTDLWDTSIRHDLAVNAAIGVAGGTSGLAVAGAIDVEDGPVTGVQIAGAVAVADDVDGSQVAGAVAVADRARGLQIAGAIAIAGGDSSTQFAGAINVADDADLQVAGAVNVADGAHSQVAGAVNVADGTVGLQVAGAVNVASRVRGLQLAPINIADDNDGVQVGVINVGGSPDGISLGLINIVPGGRTDVEASVDSRGLGTVLFRHGSRRWHNVYGVGGQRAQDVTVGSGDDLWMYGLGFGPTWKAGATTIDLEAMAWHVSTSGHYDARLSLLNQLRLSIGLDLGAVTLVAGGELNVYVGDRAGAGYLAATTQPTTPMDTTVGVHTWPSVFVGVRL